MNITNNILNIISSNKKIEQLIEVEKRLDKIGIEIKEAKNNSDIMHLKKLLDSEMQLKIDKRTLKDSLSKDEMQLYNNLKIYLEYNNYADEIRKIEKNSKKSTNLESTSNSEGRKKEIDKNLVGYYNMCVSRKNEISKEYMRAFNMLNSYEIVEKDEEEVKKEQKDSLILNRSEMPKMEVATKEEVNSNLKPGLSIDLKNKIRKGITAIALGAAVFASLVSFGGSKKTSTDSTKITKEITYDLNKNKEENEKEIADTSLSDNTTSNSVEIVKKSIAQESIEEIQEAELSIGSNIELEDNSKIMCDEYDATYYENVKKPYYDSSEYRAVEGVVYELPDGTITVARNSDEINYCENISGRNITAYLTATQYGIEGFYNVDDVKALVRK